MGRLKVIVLPPRFHQALDSRVTLVAGSPRFLESILDRFFLLFYLRLEDVRCILASVHK